MNPPLIKNLVITLNASCPSLTQHNAQIYGMAYHIEIILADYISFATTYASSPYPSLRKIDITFAVVLLTS